MTEINHFKFFVFLVVMSGQLRWITGMSRELVEGISFI
jgi:hypothetical protein